MNLTPWVIGWAVLAVAVVILMIYRWVVANREDDSLHVSDAETAVVDQQVAVAKKLAAVDLWGKILTIIAVLWGLALLGLYLYRGWVETSGPTYS
jgi:steroid 5-alpha reductase family enzyme